MIRIGYAFLMLVCLALSAPGFALLHLSTYAAVAARRLHPKAEWSNCWAWAAAEFWFRDQKWQKEGMQKGMEPRIVFRRSRHEPRDVRHTLIGEPHSPLSDLLTMMSYSPVDPTEVPLIMGWKHAFFVGHVKHGDVLTQPPNEY